MLSKNSAERLSSGIPGLEAQTAVSTSTTPQVLYAYADGADNHIRPTSVSYPNGRTIAYDYGTTGAVDDAVSRVQSIQDGTLALAGYSYLGRQTIVELHYTEPDLQYTPVDLTGSDDPDTGDIYSGLDRFGRVKDSRWYDYAGSADIDRIKYGYDRAGNRNYREVLTDPTHTYSGVWDGWNRLVKLVDEATSNTVQENAYDGRKFRVVRKDYLSGVLDETRHFYYTSRWQAMEERLGSSTAANR